MPKANVVGPENAACVVYRIATKLSDRNKFYFYRASSAELARKEFLKAYPEREKHIIAVKEFNKV